MPRQRLMNAWANGYAGPFFPHSLQRVMRLYDQKAWTVAQLDQIGKSIYGYKGYGNFKTTGKYFWFRAMYFGAELFGLGKVIIVFPWAENNKNSFLGGLNPQCAMYYSGLGFLDLEKYAAQLADAMNKMIG